MAVERTIIFVKRDCDNPYIDKATPLEITCMLEDELVKTGGAGSFKRIYSARTPPLSRRFFEQFYRHLKEWSGLDEMLDNFAGKSIAVFVYEGENIVQKIKNIAGPTKYKDNIGKNTIREIFGNENMGYRTIVHASDKKGVVYDFCILRMWNLIPELQLLKK